MEKKDEILKQKFTFLMRSEIVEQIQMFDKIEITKFYKNAYGYEIELTVGLYTYGDISNLIQSLTLCEREFYNFFDKFVAEQKENSNKVIESKEDQVSVYPGLIELKMDYSNDLSIMKWNINVEYENT
jgi:hypothetical protein